MNEEKQIDASVIVCTYNRDKSLIRTINYLSKQIYTYPNQKNFIPILAHELTHIIFREYMKKQLLPLWLDEGLAMYIETKYGKADYRRSFSYLREKIKNNSYIPFEELTSIDARDLKNKPSSYVDIFYLESFSIINFMIDKYQRHRFSSFLWNLKRKKNVKDALRATYYHFNDLKNFEERWKIFYSR
jgi:hypothetical protein